MVPRPRVWHGHETHSVGMAAIAALAAPIILWYTLWRPVAWAARLPDIHLPLHTPFWTFAVVADARSSPGS